MTKKRTIKSTNKPNTKILKLSREQFIFLMDCFLLMDEMYECSKTIHTMFSNMKYEKNAKKFKRILEKGFDEKA